MQTLKSTAARWVNFLASPAVVVFALPWLMLLLVVGTLSQRFVGLYLAENMFFASFIFWVRGVPLPGMLSVLTLITLSLFIKLFFKSVWSVSRAGTLIAHLGALLLLLGGLVTATTSHEGNLVFAAGQIENQFTDYHAREWVVTRNGKPVLTVPFTDLSAGQKISDAALPVPIQIQTACKNCQIARSGAEIHLADAPLKKLDEENIAGVEFKIADQTFMTYEDQARAPAYISGPDTYRFALEKHAYPMPFSVQLLDLSEQTYPGTDIAREYQSRVRIQDGAVHFDAVIRMNQPLRYRGYTFYQAEFNKIGDRDFSVLAVVRNTGRSFPYIASFVLCFGILLHLFVGRKKS